MRLNCHLWGCEGWGNLSEVGAAFVRNLGPRFRFVLADCNETKWRVNNRFAVKNSKSINLWEPAKDK